MSQLQPSKRSAPHVVFLVDIVQDYADGQEATARWIQHMILRILLFFLDSVDKRTTWGYRFFSSDTCSIAMSNQSFRSVSKTTIQAFLEDFTNRIANANNNAAGNSANSQPTIEEAQFTVVNRNLAQTLAEFHWSDIDLASESPRRQQQWNRQHTMDVKNFTYLVTRAPHTLSALRTYLPPEMALDDSLSLLDQVVQGLKKMHTELRKWLWEDYVYHRISLTWIDTASFDSNSNNDADAEETWICNGIASILRPFGGCHINGAILTEDYARFGLSFGAIFYECIQRKVEMTADTITSKSADELILSKYPGPVWTGTLIPHSDDHLPMQVKLYPESSHTGKPEEIAAMEMTRTLYRSQFQLRWLDRIPRSIYVLAGDEAFTSLLTELETCHRLALVRIAIASCDDVQYAILDPKVANTAILRILAPDFKPSDIKPAGTLSMYRKRSFDNRPLDYLELPAVPAKKARLSKILDDVPKVEKKQAPLSDSYSALVERIRKKRRDRREQLEAAEDVRQHHSQVQTSSPAPIEEAAAVPFPMPGSVPELVTCLRSIYLDALYTNKWLLADAMEQIHECLEYLLNNQKESAAIREVVTAIRSLAILSPDFDTKHNEVIVSNREGELPEDEKQYFAVWRGNTMRTVNSDYESRWCKALKIREGKLQILIHLLLVSLERREGILSTSHSQKELSGEVDLANPSSEYQLGIYYDRSVVWEQVYDIPGFLQDLEHTEAAGSGFRIDPSDLSLSTFFTEMHKRLSNVASDWTQFLVDRSVEEDLPDNQSFASQITNSQRSSSSFWDPPSPPEGVGSSQKISSQRTNSQSTAGKPKRPAMHESNPLTRKKSSSRNIQDLPFMRREVDLSKRKFGADKGSSSQGTKGGPMMKRASSFTKSSSISSQKTVHNESQEEDSVQIKIRQPLSPTTPRTRYERDFGFSLAGIGLTPHRNETLRSPHRTEEVLVEDDIEGARTPRRVRRLMMETTPTHTRGPSTPSHRRPRRNLTESLLAAASEAPAGERPPKVSVIIPDDDEDDEDLDLDGLFDNVNPITPFADIMGDDSDGGGIDPFQ